ncbi:MAG: hypothetical protein WBP45_07465 [Daejeonella sp.]
MHKEFYQNLFVEQTHFCPLEVGETDSSSGSRFGGVPPVSFGILPLKCPVCSGPVEYVLTLAKDILTDKIAQGKAISVFICRDIHCKLKSWQVIFPSSLLILIHKDEGRAPQGSSSDSTFKGRRLFANELRPGIVTCDDSAIGGRPGLIQNSGMKKVEELARQGFQFLAQWSEVSLPNTVDGGTYPFGFGNVYLFAPMNPTTFMPELRGMICFWQNS